MESREKILIECDSDFDSSASLDCEVLQIEESDDDTSYFPDGNASSNDDEGGVSIESKDLFDEKDETAYQEVANLIAGGNIEKLKVSHCKLYLRKYGLRLTGKKAVLLDRIRKHLEVKDGGGERKYPRSSFTVNCKGDACTGDVVLFEQTVYKMYNVASRSSTGPPLGTRTVAGRIVKESYGKAKQQHTFTIEVLWSTGIKPLLPMQPLLIKGRNLYKLKTSRQLWQNEDDRKRILDDKHSRGIIARKLRNLRIKEKEAKRRQRQASSCQKENALTSQTLVTDNKAEKTKSEKTTLPLRPNNLKGSSKMPNDGLPRVQPVTAVDKQPEAPFYTRAEKTTLPLHPHNNLKGSSTMPRNGLPGAQPVTLIGKQPEAPFYESNAINTISNAENIRYIEHMMSRMRFEEPMATQQLMALRLSQNHENRRGLTFPGGFRPERSMDGSFIEGNVRTAVNTAGFRSERVHDPSILHRRPCRFFAKGKCRYGEKCKFAHDLR